MSVTEWVSATDPYGTMTHVRLADIMAMGTREQDGQQFGVLWMRNTVIMFWCSLDELERARNVLLR